MTIKGFTREEMASLPTKLLRDGRAANARVTCVTWQGRQWTVKDFAPRNWWVRTFLAPFLLGHEFKILQKLKGIDGVASDSFRIDRHAVAIEFLPGARLAKTDPKDISTQYLVDMEALLQNVHDHGVVHLDTRGTGNWLVSPEGKPLLIDFQAALTTGWMPASWRRVVELVDMSGVYKKWKEWQPETMGAEREALYEEALRWRRKWVFEGYFGTRKRRHARKKRSY